MATAAIIPPRASEGVAPSAPRRHPISLTPSQIAIVKSTAPVLKEHGVTITTLFYRNMLEANPALKNIFSMTSQATGAQPRALAASVLAYATYVDDLPALQHAVERIAHKHVSLNIRPEHYPIVGKYLMEAIGQVLGDAATPEIVDAWTAAYGVLADIFINLEARMYEAHKNWIGWRKFKIVRREKESDMIDSFYFSPVDGAPLPTFLPGQYVSVQVFVPELNIFQSRQYSLSAAPRKDGDHYRISVKKEHGLVQHLPGVVSNLLHSKYNVGDEVELSHPQGEFFVDPEDQSKRDVPLVLISAGVGATPVFSILESLSQEAQGVVKRPISWIHGSHTRALQAFADQVRHIQQANTQQITSKIFLSDVSDQALTRADYDFEGKLDLHKIDAEQDLFLTNCSTEYYICGPEAFMMGVRRVLESMGVQRGRTHLELFATGDVQ